MDKSLKSVKRRNARSKKTKINDIRAFTERPSGNFINGGLNEKGALGAADLFSHFTANIIKENTLFTR